MINSLKFWLECARWYALPMSFFSWLIVFCFALLNGGNPVYGVLALLGISLLHLATNLFDDFCDFHSLKKYTDDNDKLVLPNTQRGKCKYIIENRTEIRSVLFVVFLLCLIAFLIGCFFFFSVGKEVTVFILIGALIVLLYSILSKMRLAEVAVALAFGPLLFSGVYFVMCGKFIPQILILSVPSAVFTVNLLFTDMFLDRNIDIAENKKTFAGLFKNEENILKFQKILLFLGYLSVFLIPVFDIADWQVFFVFITIPLAIDLSDSLKLYSEDKTSVPEKKWYHFPFEKWDDIVENRSPVFMFRMYQARNLMIYFSIIFIIGLFLD